jgi:hypothetical protein
LIRPKSSFLPGKSTGTDAAASESQPRKFRQNLANGYSTVDHQINSYFADI